MTSGRTPYPSFRVVRDRRLVAVGAAQMGHHVECVVRVAVVGDYQPDHETHPQTTVAVERAGAALGVAPAVSWIGTSDAEGLAGLEEFDGVWIAPRRPYRSLDGALAAITFARTSGVPLLGTCAGFQHIVLEFTRSVVGDAAAQHAEY